MRLHWVGFFFGLAACGSSPPEITESPLLDDQGRLLPLRCPGAPGCARAEGELWVGAGKRAITPQLEAFTDQNGNGRWDGGEPFDDENANGTRDATWIAGFGRGREATSVHDDLWARALAFRRGDLRVGLVSLDLIGLFQDDVIRIRQAAREAGLGFDHIVVGTTHQHEGPDTMGPWGATPFETGRDPAYTARLVRDVVDALSEAVEAERSASLTIGTAEAPHLIHDSRRPTVIDPSVTALLARNAAGAPLAALVVFGNHPETLDGDNQAITSDYPHYLRERIELEYPGALAVFVPGTLGGLMNPLHINGCPNAQGERTCPAGTFELAEYVGVGVAEAAIEALARATPSNDRTLAVRREPMLLGFGNLGFVTAFVSGILERTLFDDAGARIPPAIAANLSAEEALSGHVRLQSEVGALTLGPLELLMVPGELYPELWLAREDGSAFIEVREGADHPDAPPETPLSLWMPSGRVHAIMNQANDALGYIIPKVQYDFEPPFVYEGRQYGEVNSVGPDIAPSISEAVARMYEETPSPSR